jgi:hypothetical protein
MSIQEIIQHAIDKNPLALKEALEEELRGRVALALEAKMREQEEDEDDEDDDEDDEDEDMKESFDLSGLTLEELEDFMMSEEFEQLDELDKKTLASYVKKAQTSSKRANTYKSKAQDDAARANRNLHKGYSGDYRVDINKQYNRLDKASDKVAKHDKTIDKRTTGIDRAKTRLAK